MVEAKKNYLCVDDPNGKIKIQGTRESPSYGTDSSIFINFIYRCKNDTNDPTAPVCKTKEEIDEWLLNKNIQPISMNKAPNFDSFEKFTNEWEAVFRSIRLNRYTDTGYRFVYNEYNRVD